VAAPTTGRAPRAEEGESLGAPRFAFLALALAPRVEDAARLACLLGESVFAGPPNPPTAPVARQAAVAVRMGFVESTEKGGHRHDRITSNTLLVVVQCKTQRSVG
jgi:hypothetical protein